MSSSPAPSGVPPEASAHWPSRGAASEQVPTTSSHLAWLEEELPGWVSEGLVTADSAVVLRGRYVAHRRFTLIRLALTLGAAFVGVGLIWLVAANLDQLSPMVRFVLFVLVWLAFLIGGELLADRRAAHGGVATPMVGTIRLLAAAAYGAVAFQAAQSLQVPAYAPVLVGVWALGALVHGYAVRALAPVTLGVVLAAVWLAWQSMSGHTNGWVLALALLSGGAVAVVVGIVHEHRWWPAAAYPWREIGAALVLLGMFVAAIPGTNEHLGAAWLTWVALIVAVVLIGPALVLSRGLARLEVSLAALGLALGGGIAAWSSTDAYRPGSDVALTGMGLARPLVAVLAYLVVAIGYAVLGTLRDSSRIVVAALAALVAFVTFQAFAVFAPILSGAALFLLVGVVLIGSGILADRSRRRLARGATEVLS